MSEKKVLIFTEEYFKATTGMYAVVENLFLLSKKENSSLKLDLCVNFEHWTTNTNLIRLPRLSVAEHIRAKTLSFRSKSFLIKLVIYLVTTPIYFFDKIFIIIYLKNFLQKNNYKILNVHNGGWPAGWISRVIIISAWLSNCKIIYNIHNSPLYFNFFSFKYNKLLFVLYSRLIYKFIYPSDFLNMKFRLYGCKKGYVIHNGTIDFGFNSINFSSHKQRNILRIGFVGTLSKFKNPKDVILLAHSKFGLADRLKIIHFGYLNDEFITECGFDISKFKRLNSYEFKSFSDDRQFIYSNFDILLAPSRQNESFGMVVIEAMSFGLPVICYSGNAYPELISNNFNGFIYRDFIELENIIETYLNNPKLVNEHGNNARIEFERKFCSEKFLFEYKSIFNNALS